MNEVEPEFLKFYKKVNEDQKNINTAQFIKDQLSMYLDEYEYINVEIYPYLHNNRETVQYIEYIIRTNKDMLPLTRLSSMFQVTFVSLCDDKTLEIYVKEIEA